MDLLALQFQIHQQNKAAGWYDNPRTFHRETALYNTELAEAVEGIRKGMIKDDHLPQYPMHVVEVADYIIRQMCYLGNLGNSKYPDAYDAGDYHELPEVDLNKLALITMTIWADIQTMRDAANEGWKDLLRASQAETSVYAIGLIKHWGYDPEEIIQEKLHYNRSRPDHTTECRAAEGGKKW